MGLKASKARIKAGNRYVAPERLPKSAREAMAQAINALDEAVRNAEFEGQYSGEPPLRPRQAELARSESGRLARPPSAACTTSDRRQPRTSRVVPESSTG